MGMQLPAKLSVDTGTTGRRQNCMPDKSCCSRKGKERIVCSWEKDPKKKTKWTRIIRQIRSKQNQQIDQCGHMPNRLNAKLLAL